MTKPADLIASLKQATPPFTPERERELIALAYGHADKKVAAAAQNVVKKHLRDAGAIKTALGGHLGRQNHQVIDERLRRLPRKDRGLVATELVKLGINAHGLAVEENQEFAREYIYKLLRPKGNELYLTEAPPPKRRSGYFPEYVELTTIPDVVFDELPGLRKRQKFDRVVLWGTTMTTLPARFVEFAPFLKSLVLGYVDFTDLPMPVIACTHLEVLEIHAFTLLRLNKRLPELTKLRRLAITESKAMRTMPLEICDLPALEELDLGFAKYSTLPKEIAKLKTLEKLDLQSSSISKLPPEIASLPNLKHINIRWSRLKPDAVKALLPKVKIEE